VNDTHQISVEALNSGILNFFSLLYNQKCQAAKDGRYFKTVPEKDKIKK
jgi:hypothetical protein